MWSRYLPMELQAQNSDQTCAICLDEYEVDDVLCVLPCRHIFHKRCVERWVLKVAKGETRAASDRHNGWDEEALRACACPLCKGAVFPCSSSGNAPAASVAASGATPDLELACSPVAPSTEVVLSTTPASAPAPSPLDLSA